MSLMKDVYSNHSTIDMKLDKLSDGICMLAWQVINFKIREDSCHIRYRKRYMQLKLKRKPKFSPGGFNGQKSGGQDEPLQEPSQDFLQLSVSLELPIIFRCGISMTIACYFYHTLTVQITFYYFLYFIYFLVLGYFLRPLSGVANLPN